MRSFLGLNVWLAICTLGAIGSLGVLTYDYIFVSHLSGLVRAYGWGKVPREAVLPYDRAVVMVLYLGGGATYWIGFFVTMIKSRSVAQHLGIVGHKWSAWAFVSFIVPIVGFVIPWLVIGEIRRSIISSARRSARDDSWIEKSRFSAATVVVAICITLIGFSIQYWSQLDLLAFSPNGIAQTVEDMGFTLTVLAVCTLLVLAYLFTTRAALGSLSHGAGTEAGSMAGEAAPT